MFPKFWQLLWIRYLRMNPVLQSHQSVGFKPTALFFTNISYGANSVERWTSSIAIPASGCDFKALNVSGIDIVLLLYLQLTISYLSISSTWRHWQITPFWRRILSISKREPYQCVIFMPDGRTLRHPTGKLGKRYRWQYKILSSEVRWFVLICVACRLSTIRHRYGRE